MAPGDKALHDLCVPAGVDGDVRNALSGVSGCKRARADGQCRHVHAVYAGHDAEATYEDVGVGVDGDCILSVILARSEVTHSDEAHQAQRQHMRTTRRERERRKG